MTICATGGSQSNLPNKVGLNDAFIGQITDGTTGQAAQKFHARQCGALWWKTDLNDDLRFAADRVY